jgi:hypothetical protein
MQHSEEEEKEEEARSGQEKSWTVQLRRNRIN